MARMRVSALGLNLRRAPGKKKDNVIGSLRLADPVDTVGDETARWTRVRAKIDGSVCEGFVAKRFLRESVSDLKESLLHQCATEWYRFDMENGREASDPYFRFVGEMWASVGYPERDGRLEVPWSAAFVSYVMRNAGYANFRFSAAHCDYIRQALVGRLNEDSGIPFWAYELNEYRPGLGDLVCAWRNKGVNLANLPTDFFAAHCDVVVEQRATFVRTIGGNVGDRVLSKRFAIDENGHLYKKKGQMSLFAVLRNNR